MELDNRFWQESGAGKKESQNHPVVYLQPDVEKELSERLARVRGHVEVIRGMLLKRTDCNALVVQLATVRRALDEVTLQLLDGHIETCVLQNAQKGEMNRALENLRWALAQLFRLNFSV